MLIHAHLMLATTTEIVRVALAQQTLSVLSLSLQLADSAQLTSNVHSLQFVIHHQEHASLVFKTLTAQQD